MVMKLKVELPDVQKVLAKIQKRAESVNAATRNNAYVGVPSENSRKVTKKVEAAKIAVSSGHATKKQKKTARRATVQINNAELLFIHTKGSPIRNILARPVLEPSILANKEIISRELGAMLAEGLNGTSEGVKRTAKRAALAGQNAAREWFTDPRNGWAPNSARTIAAKGSDQPLIDTGSLRSAIVGVVVEE